MKFGNPFILKALLLAIGVIGARAADEFATRFYYERQDVEKTEISPSTPAQELASLFDSKQPLKIIVHGWMENSKSYSTELLKSELHPQSLRLKMASKRRNMFYKNKKQETTDIGYLYTPYNIIVADWSVYSLNGLYTSVLKSVPLASADIANLVDALVAANVTTKRKVHIVGYDVGAHVAGSAGSYMDPKPGRITGLDAYAAGYGNGGLDNWLDKNDAVFVDTIHTCGGGYLGLDVEYGHVDFYPNKGLPPQPTCQDAATSVTCSHLEAVRFFYNSINYNKLYPATKSSSWENFVSNNCAIPKPTYMGEGISTSAAPGKYYLLTDGNTCA